MKRNRTFAFMTAALCAAICLSVSGLAQTKPEVSARELLKEDPNRAGNLHHCYESLEGENTAAPEGYSAFYVSHFGRHGSRYLSSAHELDPVMEALEFMKEKNLLTKKGEELYQDYRKLVKAHEGMHGMLTQKGGREHREIAARLYARVPEVFNQSGRDSVTCVSTQVHRCIQSMANFTLSLKECAPGLKVAYYAGDRYKSYLNRDTDDSECISAAKHVEDEALKEEFDCDRLVSTYFRSLVDGRIGEQRPQKFFYYLFKTGAISQCLDGDAPDFLSRFTGEELYQLWRINNIRCYASMCNSIESEGVRNERAAYILKDIVEKADLALKENSRVAADLRFGHDSGIGPLISLLALEGNDARIYSKDACKYWYCFQNICMGTNLQIIFYRNGEGKVLVKFLHNEKERSIPALTPVSGNYYSWPEVRSWMTDLIRQSLD
ncbi:MAG: hypothetical protein PUB91_02670 [Bacteroidales bacterium]|nr:hypothetical protein [Bacteroidales bacterium]